MSERTVITQAIPASGSLWLGCRSSEHVRGSVPGEVELYLFRMWADLSSHGACEDGSLVGWNARDWGLTSARAGRRDPDLQCGETDGCSVLTETFTKLLNTNFHCLSTSSFSGTGVCDRDRWQSG